jgi:hypothetical protein
MNKPTSLNRYSLSDGSSRWWWPSATAGAAATLALVAIVGSSSANAIPVDTDRYHSVPEQTVPAPRVGSGSIHSQDNIPRGFGQCFMWQSHWNDALNGPQPWCRLKWF